jgi:hypothetical protein
MSRTAEAALESSPAPRPEVGRARLVVAAVVLGYLAHVAWRFWLTRTLDAPSAHADEDAYLLAARAIAGGPGGGTTENRAFRRLGYPLMIGPAYLFTSDAFTVYKAALGVNAFINALVFPLSYLFARRALGLGRLVAFGGGFVAAALPAVLFYAEFTFIDAVVAPFAIGWLLLAHWWLTASRPVAAVAAGATAGLYYAVHVRGIVFAFVHVLLCLALVALRRTSWRVAGLSVAALACGAALDPALKLFIRGEINTYGRSPDAQLIDAVTTGGGILRTLGGAGGQFWYLSVATLGLGAVGVVAAALAVRRRPGSHQLWPRDLVLVAALLVTVLIALSSAAALPPADERVNYFAYPRYVHMLYPVWLLIGFAALLTAGTLRRAVALAAAGVGLTVASGALVYLRLRDSAWSVFIPFDAPEIMFLSGRWTGLEPVRASVVALLALLAIVPLVRWARYGPAAVLGALLVVNSANVVAVTDRVTEPMASTQYPPGTPRLVRDGYVHRGDRVAFALRHQQTWYTLYQHMREVDFTRLKLFDQTTQDLPAGYNVVIGPWPTTDTANRWDGTRYGYRLVVVDDYHGWAVWRRD